jgi:hypothetical protein
VMLRRQGDGRCDAAKANNNGGGELHARWRTTAQGEGRWRCDAASSPALCDAAMRRQWCDAAATGGSVMPPREDDVSDERLLFEVAARLENQD